MGIPYDGQTGNPVILIVTYNGQNPLELTNEHGWIL
jgi:hypothetical protein